MSTDPDKEDKELDDFEQDESLDFEPRGLTEFDEAYNRERDALPTNVRVIIEKVSWQIRHEGLNLEEACLITNVDFKWLSAKVDQHPIIARIIAKKELQFKIKLQKPMVAKAKHDDKMAQYLYELKYPKSKLKAGDDVDTSGDMLAAAVEHIQEHGDSTPLVNRESGKAVIFAKGKSAAALIKKISDMLK